MTVGNVKGNAESINQPKRRGEMFRLIFIIYLVVYCIVVIKTSHYIITDTLNDGYYNLQIAIAWIIPVGLCLPSSAAALLAASFLSEILLFIAVKVLNFPLDDMDVTGGIISTISIGTALIGAAFLQYYLFMKFPQHIKSLTVNFKKAEGNSNFRIIVITTTTVLVFFMVYYLFYIVLQ